MFVVTLLVATPIMSYALQSEGATSLNSTEVQEDNIQFAQPKAYLDEKPNLLFWLKNQ